MTKTINLILSRLFNSISFKFKQLEIILANSAQARKRARQAVKHHDLNASKRTHMRTYLKRTIAAIESKNKEEATQAYKIAAPILDKMANKGIIHKNKAARQKSRLNARIRAL